MPVLLSHFCYSKLPQTALKTTETYSPTVVESKTSQYIQGVISGKNLLLSPSTLWDLPGIRSSSSALPRTQWVPGADSLILLSARSVSLAPRASCWWLFLFSLHEKDSEGFLSGPDTWNYVLKLKRKLNILNTEDSVSITTEIINK